MTVCLVEVPSRGQKSKGKMVLNRWTVESCSCPAYSGTSEVLVSTGHDVKHCESAYLLVVVSWR